jgi:hypothetical protein
MDGSQALGFLAHSLQAVLNFAVREPIGLWFPGEPVRLQAWLTREDAEAYVRAFPRLLPQPADDDPSPVRLFVRPTTDDRPTLFAPADK